MKKNFILCALFVFFSKIESESVFFEYVYPIALLDQSHLLVLQQIAIDDIQLWVWDMKSHTAYKELNSLYLPFGVQILPGNTAYSFIDRGRLKIKSFNKRTPKTIEFDESIYAISCLKWINDDMCYFAAKYKGFFRVFLCEIADHKVTLSALHDLNKPFNFTYPCKIEEELFYIVNDHDRYDIRKCLWKKQENLTCAQTYHEESCVVTGRSNQLCFLHMYDAKNGFVLELIDTSDTMVYFSCLKISQSDKCNWDVEQLFDFKLPKDLIFGFDQARLYESIYPFLPQYFKDFLFFTDFDESYKGCQIYQFNYKTKEVFRINSTPLQDVTVEPVHCFSPLLYQNTIFYGSSNYRQPQETSLVVIDPKTGLGQFCLPSALFSDLS